MSDPDEAVSESTRLAEDHEEHRSAGADREPTPEESAAAEANPPIDPEVGEHFRHQAEVGAEVAGEGAI